MHLALLRLLCFLAYFLIWAPCLFFQALDNLVAWIVVDCTQLEKEINEWHKLCDCAKRAFKKWKANKAAQAKEKKDLDERLEQSEGQVQSLQDDVETHGNELVELHDEICWAQEAKNKDDFNLKLLGFELAQL